MPRHIKSGFEIDENSYCETFIIVRFVYGELNEWSNDMAL